MRVCPRQTIIVTLFSLALVATAYADDGRGSPPPTSCGLSQVDERSLEAAYIGERAGLLLVELPRESLSGRWRVWVPKSAVA